MLVTSSGMSAWPLLETNTRPWSHVHDRIDLLIRRRFAGSVAFEELGNPGDRRLGVRLFFLDRLVGVQFLENVQAIPQEIVRRAAGTSDGVALQVAVVEDGNAGKFSNLVFNSLFLRNRSRVGAREGPIQCRRRLGGALKFHFRGAA
jgi:hypothetical protein